MKSYEKLKLLREEKKLSVDELVKETGLSAQAIRNYEKPELDRLPNTSQLKTLKDYFGVSYEYILDDDCINKTHETIDIGKKLKLSDQALENIISLQYKNGRIPKELINSLVDDKESPVVFSNWLESIDIAEYVVLIREYQTLNKILDASNYLYGIKELNSYILDCINNKCSLDELFTLLLNTSSNLKKLFSKSIFSDYSNNDIKELNGEINKFKDFYTTAKPNKVTLKDVINVTVFIEGFGEEIIEKTKRSIKYCEFEITDLIKSDLENNYKCDIVLPPEYKNLVKKEGK